MKLYMNGKEIVKTKTITYDEDDFRENFLAELKPIDSELNSVNYELRRIASKIDNILEDTVKRG